MVQLDVAVVEVPAGDSFVNSDLWSFVDEQVVPLEKKALLEDNGLRIGQVGSTPPAGLLELLTQKRSCPGPRRVSLPPGKAGRPLDLGPPRERCLFYLRQDDQPVKRELEQVRCSLGIVPVFTEDGKVRLTCKPQMQHAGKGRTPWKPRADRSGWALQVTQPTETFDTLGWDIGLAPGEFLLVGARFDRPATLGHTIFVRTDEAVPVQRLLVIRAGRQGPTSSADSTPTEDGSPSPPPPLALQAGWSSIRGACP
jgi:hypothetical protein